jgi:hypothetical protein
MGVTVSIDTAMCPPGPCIVRPQTVADGTPKSAVHHVGASG